MSKTSQINPDNSPLGRHLNRREFLENSARNAAGLTAGSLSIAAAHPRQGPIRIGMIGLGQQGYDLALRLAKEQDAEIVALYDIDVRPLARAQQEIHKTQATRPLILPNSESLLSRDDIDAIVLATPDHSHAVLAENVLRSGKDLYLETPVAHTLSEGEKLLQLSEQSGQIVQVGLPQRSGPHFQSAVSLIQSGFLGKVHQAKAWVSHRRKSIGYCAPASPPLGVDYKGWLRPVGQQPFYVNRFHKNWAWFWQFGSGELGLWGVHQLDLVRWALQLDLPQRVSAHGGLYSFKDDRETPDTLAVHYEFPELEVTWEHRQWSNRGIEGRSSGVAFYGELGTLIVDRSGWKAYDHPQEKYCGASEIHQSHLHNFLQAVRTRTQPVASMMDGQNATIMCHLGNLAYRSQQPLDFDPSTRKLLNIDSIDNLL